MDAYVIRATLGRNLSFQVLRFGLCDDLSVNHFYTQIGKSLDIMSTECRAQLTLMMFQYFDATAARRPRWRSDGLMI